MSGTPSPRGLLTQQPRHASATDSHSTELTVCTPRARAQHPLSDVRSDHHVKTNDVPAVAVGSLCEADLFKLWYAQRFPPGVLVTAAGEPVHVAYRGRPGRGAGPDFRDARISIGGAPPRLGDVELHVCAADFRRHGHAADPAYGGVMLHVVFDAGTERETRLPGGGRAPVLALRPWVQRRAAEIAAHASPNQASTPWREPCYTAVQRLGAAQVSDILAREGTVRLQVKAHALALIPRDVPPRSADVSADTVAKESTTAQSAPADHVAMMVATERAAADHTPPRAAVPACASADTSRTRPTLSNASATVLSTDSDQTLYWAICAALGLSRNVAPFTMLAERAPLTQVLAAAGTATAPERATNIRTMLLRAAGFDAHAPALARLPWRLDRVRPGAHPRGRIEGLSVVLGRLGRDSLSLAVHNACEKGARSLLSFIVAPGIGSGRAVEVAVNAVLPWLLVRGEESLALELAAHLPSAGAYGPLNLLEHALVSEEAGSATRSLARRTVLAQQGALALHNGWCTRGGCGVCPLS